jgi:hypothetical protein
MAYRRHPPDILKEAIALVEKHGTVSAAARAAGMPRATLDNRITDAIIRGMYKPEQPKPSERPSLGPSEVQDAAFWRRRYQEEHKRAVEAQRLAEHLAGIRNADFQIPEWIMKTGEGRRGKSVIGLLISDVHLGEVIKPGEVAGVNEFNVDVCIKRMERYFEAACTVGQRWSSDTDCAGALVALNGDLISGDIHEELRQTNELTSTEQVQAVAGLVVNGLLHVAATYGAVHVVGVPGNHGRTTPKPTAKLYSRLSYDIMICAMVRDRLRDDARFTWQFGESPDQAVPIFGRTAFVTHGDKMGTGGGQGFAGPNLPIIRGGHKIIAQQASFGRKPDLLLLGHYHVSTNPGCVLSNGSVPGYSEYGSSLRAAFEPPQQWLFLLHDKWWLRERSAIQLEDPAVPDKPRIRVPMGFAA